MLKAELLLDQYTGPVLGPVYGAISWRSHGAPNRTPPPLCTMPAIDSLTFANNKGGSGKTFLGVQIACEAARAAPNRKVLVVDLSLYSETSGILMGGLTRKDALAPTTGRMRTVRLPPRSTMYM
jgi:hypothetical protein